MRQTAQYPRAFTHLGISVPDLDAATTFYQNVFGLNVVFGPRLIEANGTHLGKLSSAVYGPAFRQAKVVFLGTANGVVVELFQFIEPASQPHDGEFNYWRSGCFHICFFDPDVEGLLEEVVRYGGKVRTPVWEIDAGSGKRLAFCEDPFGNVIELYSQSTEQMVSNLIIHEE